MHVRLLLAGFAAPPDAQVRLPALEKLLARGRRTSGPWTSAGQWLLEGFGVERQADWPSAPFALRGDGGNPGEAFWVHADPVHLAAGNTQVAAAGGDALAITREEADAFAGTINAHFGSAMQVFPLRPGRWYARLAAPPPGAAAPLADVLECGIDVSGIDISGAGDPDTGESAIGWHALMNELQMLLFEHPLNLAREERGAPAVNGVWLWGGGRDAPANAAPVTAVHADLPLAAGLASAAGVRAGPLPGRAAALLGHTHSGVVLAIHERADVEALERDWMAPLAQALSSGDIGMLTLHLATGEDILSVENTRSDLRRFWRRPRPLAHWLPRAESDSAR